MVWEPFALAVIFGLLISAGLYFVVMWPQVAPDDDAPDEVATHVAPVVAAKAAVAADDAKPEAPADDATPEAPADDAKPEAPADDAKPEADAPTPA